MITTPQGITVYTHLKRSTEMTKPTSVSPKDTPQSPQTSIQASAKDSVQISAEAQRLFETRQVGEDSWWDDWLRTTSAWMHSGIRWLKEAGTFALAAAKAGLDFLVLDDVKTAFNPKASNMERGLAVLSLFPVGKGAKAGKQVYDLLQKHASDVADFANNALKGRTQIGKWYVRSHIDKDPLILKETEKAMADRTIQRDANHLISEYLKGNTNPGSGNKHLFDGVFELRSRDGARVYLRTNGDTLEILGKSDKHNQSKVIKRLEELYGKKR